VDIFSPRAVGWLRTTIQPFNGWSVKSVQGCQLSFLLFLIFVSYFWFYFEFTGQPSLTLR
jgi:hypothetical protein